MQSSAMNRLRRAWSRVEFLATGRRSWQGMEYFDESWKRRIEEMARYISPGESVIDLGCGKMWLKPLLKDNLYYGVDYRTRGENTIVADFNSHQFPDIAADVAFVSGALEYVEDYEWFAREICSHTRRCVLSYCTTEHYPDLNTRNEKAWKSHLSRAKLLELFGKNGMYLDSEITTVPQNSIFVFSSPGTDFAEKL